MTEHPIEAWPETLKVLEEAQTVTELNARLVGLVDVFKQGGGDEGVEAAKILSFLADKQVSVFKELPPQVPTKLREALDRMAETDPTAKELRGKC